MSLPRNINADERRKSIAKLTRSPLSSSPLLSHSPGRFNNSRPGSFSSNSPFLKNRSSPGHEDLQSGLSVTVGAGGVNVGGDVFEDENDSNSDVASSIILQATLKYLSPKPDVIKTEGADITRDIYKMAAAAEQHQEEAGRPPRRSRSFSSMDDLLSQNEVGSRRGSTASSLNVPGGFRREFVYNQQNKFQTKETNFLTRNFVEFLSIYGHFAGEDLEDEEDLIACHYKPPIRGENGERSLLLTHHNYNHPQSRINPNGTATDGKAYFLLLKAFVGTGVLFLPKAFANGGLVFSISTLFFFGILSFWCYLILVYAKKATKLSSFGEIGLKLYGKWLQQLIFTSILLSQIGFVGAYIVFTLENLRSFYSSIMGVEDPQSLNILWFTLIQLIVFLPLSLIRDITKLSLLALLANVFILIGLVTIIYFTGVELFLHNHGQILDTIKFYFNENDFSLFIGVAIFAFEGIGLILPIEQSMIHPDNFPKVLFKVIMTISAIFIGIGSLGYLTFGEKVETVIILNLPQDSPMIMAIQLLYAFAILLSTPLQLFPAIRLAELKIFPKRTGKTSLLVKWQKNIFRFAFVCFTAVVAIFGGQNLDRFVSFVGCFACIPLVYMYPPILHLKSCCNYNQWGILDSEKRKRYWLSILDIVLVIIGGVAMVYTTYQIIVG